MNETPCVLAIDLGSSGPKISVVDIQGNILATRSGHFESIYSENGAGVEQDAEEWWTQILRLSKEVLDESGTNGRIVAISNCAQYFTSVPVDEKGNCTGPAVMWEDSRSAKHIRKKMGGFPSVKGYQLFRLLRWLYAVGVPPILNGVDAASHMLFLKTEKPEVWKKTYKVLEPSDFLSLRFTGRFTTNENTGFAYTLLRKAPWGKSTFHEKLIRALDLDEKRLPEVVKVGEDLGFVKPETASFLGISDRVRVFSGMVDTTAFMLGAGAFDDYEMVVDLGTTLTTGVHVPKRIIDILNGAFSIASPVENKYVLIGELGTGSKAVNVLIHNVLRRDDLLTIPKEDEELHVAEIADRMAAVSPAGSRGVVFLPWFFGSNFPEQDTNLRGGFLNLGPTTAREDMVRAVFESYAFTLRWMTEITEQNIGRKISKIKLCGGGALWPTVAQIMADTLQIPVELAPEPRQTNTRGVAFMCFHHLGLADYTQLQKLCTPRKSFAPDGSNKQVYDDRYRFFKRLYPRMRRIYADLNRQA